MNKSELRKKIKQLLKSKILKTSNEHTQLSRNLKQLLDRIKSEKKVQRLKIGVYSPFAQEPIWFNQIDDLSNDYLMVHMHDERKLSFHQVDLGQIKSGDIGFKLDEKYLAKSDTPDLILIPGLAYSKNFERLGRGGGYFDSYLEKFQGIKVGLFFTIQEVDDVYREEHDQYLDYLVTEKDISIRGI